MESKPIRIRSSESIQIQRSRRKSDTIADAAFIAADVAIIANEGATVVNVVALGADILGAATPLATGLGSGVRLGAAAYRGSKLARSMDNVGRAVKKGIEQAHHIVAQGAKAAAEARAALQKVGIDIHSAQHGAAVKNADHAASDHAEMHTKKYYSQVNAASVEASKAQNLRRAMEDMLESFRKKLESME
jgi:hypothetical protein